MYIHVHVDSTDRINNENNFEDNSEDNAVSGGIGIVLHHWHIITGQKCLWKLMTESLLCVWPIIFK